MIGKIGKISCGLVRDILESQYEFRSEMVPCFIGPPGIGKTQGIYRFAEEKGVKVVTFILSNTVPSEVSGIRMPDKETKKLEVFDDSRMASLEDGDILFFDEILQAPPILWSACLTLIQDRIMASGRKLPDVMIVAASNPVVSPGIIPPSVRDRFNFFEVCFDGENWKEWLAREHRIFIEENLLSQIQEDSDGYNILTPRSATKKMLWMRKYPQFRDVQKMSLAHQYDEYAMQLLVDSVDNEGPKRTKREQILDVVGEFVDDVPEEWTELSLTQLFELLKERDEWSEIEKALAATPAE